MKLPPCLVGSFFHLSAKRTHAVKVYQPLNIILQLNLWLHAANERQKKWVLCALLSYMELQWKKKHVVFTHIFNSSLVTYWPVFLVSVPVTTLFPSSNCHILPWMISDCLEMSSTKSMQGTCAVPRVWTHKPKAHWPNT